LGENASKIQMNPGEHYTSCFDMLNDKKVKQFKYLCCYDKDKDTVNTVTASRNISELKNDIISFDRPMFHFVRTPNGYNSDIVIANFERYMDIEYKYIKYDHQNQIKDENNNKIDINIKLAKRPQVHTFIFIKENLRCSKTLTKTFLGINYERYVKNPTDSVIIQGALGRLTGYDYNGKSICYTNIDTIKRYRKLWNSNFEDRSVEWKSTTTKKKNGKLYSKETFNTYPRDDDYISSSDEKKPTIKQCNIFEEVSQHFDNILKKKEKFKNLRGPGEPSKSDDGFYHNYLRGITKVWSLREVKKNSGWGINDKYKFRLHTCYKNVNDPDTVQFCLIYYD
jgi:hypothetical protein